MNLSTRAASSFDARVRSRGTEYDLRGRVRVLSGSASEVMAKVTGTSVYTVSIGAEGSRLAAWCDCPYAEADLCKHIWATLCTAERKGHLSAVTPGNTPVLVRLDPLDDDPELDPDPAADAGRHLALVPSSRAVSVPRAPIANSVWRSILGQARDPARSAAAARTLWANQEIAYVIGVDGATARVQIVSRARGRGGRWKPASIGLSSVAHLADENDRVFFAGLGANAYAPSYGSVYDRIVPSRVILAAGAMDLLVRLIGTGRAYWESLPDVAGASPIVFDDGPPWEPSVEVAVGGERTIEVRGWLVRGDERIDVVTPQAVLPGLLIHRGRASRVRDEGAFGMVTLLRTQGVIDVPLADLGALVEELSAWPGALRVEIAPDLGFTEEAIVPRPCARFLSPRESVGVGGFGIVAQADYGGARVDLGAPGRVAVDAGRRRIVRRDADAEQQAVGALGATGARPLTGWYRRDGGPNYYIAVGRFSSAVRSLVAAGWYVEANGKPQRAAGAINVEVTSGIDWFDLSIRTDFGGASTSMAEILAAVKRRTATVVLDDGSIGIIPEEWLRRWGLLLGSGTIVDGRVRFKKTQATLLDTLIAEMPAVSSGEALAVLKRSVASFEAIRAADAPRGFVGTLRDYQREGLGWTRFLRAMRFGGCLADDMGLGKTVQVLATLLDRKRERRKRRPSLVVAPKSLVFNWIDEAARFAPGLTIVEHGGTGRAANAAAFDDCDVVITTYGTLRQDAALLRTVPFDYVVLDEATAIKNAGSSTAKAARLLSAEHRIALSGTPVENHLGELWSLFEFLNPGMLGAASVFKQWTGNGRAVDAAGAPLVGRVLRPFLLRRTKSQVASELPDRIEKTLTCDLGRDERSFYDELKRHVQASLRKRVDRDGIARSTVHILEGLLRLRQAACHPGLIDRDRAPGSSSKIDVLLEQIALLGETGEKAIVFSQFTSLLAIVRRQLDDARVAYEYLDGRTRDRKRPVDRFQNDPACPLFLISLKAGGHGLNLTAARQVFLLDPWWNPAVEAQAIDRAHRIGQTETVVAYRLIARDTIEQKVAELQRRKRELADAVLGESAGGIASLTREDLELLMG